ncbi:hypothetical protein ACQ4PT_017683 [Festuca glaucescens]
MALLGRAWVELLVDMVEATGHIRKAVLPQLQERGARHPPVHGGRRRAAWGPAASFAPSGRRAASSSGWCSYNPLARLAGRGGRSCSSSIPGASAPSWTRRQSPLLHPGKECLGMRGDDHVDARGGETPLERGLDREKEIHVLSPLLRDEVEAHASLYNRGLCHEQGLRVAALAAVEARQWKRRGGPMWRWSRPLTRLAQRKKPGNTVAMVLDVLASYVGDLLKQVAEEELGLLLGVTGEIDKMGDKLQDFKNFLADADRRNITDETVREWVGQLKRAMYEATDILDHWRT